MLLTHFLQGLLSLDAAFDFVGYVSIGEQKSTLFPLYVSFLFLETCRSVSLCISVYPRPSIL